MKPMNGISGEDCGVRYGRLVEATFLCRDNRFRVQVQIGDQVAAAHLPNSGRLAELLVAGRRVWLTPAKPAARLRRRTAYDLTLVEHAGRLVSVDSRLPGDLVAHALRCGLLGAEFGAYSVVRREVRLGKSRIDFLLEGARLPSCWLEIKSVTLVTAGVARFPDAPTSRGRRHVLELTQAVKDGDRAAVLFVVQRDDATSFSPHDSADPPFGQALRHAVAVGVRVLAVRCRVTRDSAEVLGIIPVVLP